MLALTARAEENGTDPISGEPLAKDDLIDVKASECQVYFPFDNAEQAEYDLGIRTQHSPSPTRQPDFHPGAVDRVAERV